MSENEPTGLTRRNALKGLAGLAGSTSLAGCSATRVGLRNLNLPGTYKDETLRYAQVRPPVSLDPVETDDPWSMQAARRLFEGLYAYDRELNLVPVLAAGEPKRSSDGTTYTVTLKSEPRFQNGDPVTAEDVKYSFEAPVAEDARPKWQVNMLADVRTPDERTVEFHLREPYPAFEHALTRLVVPKSVREENKYAFGRTYAAGSGPYKLGDSGVFKRGKYALFERWGDYWGTKPAVNWVKFANTHSGLARTMSLKTGQNDVVERIQPQLWRATEKIPSARVARTDGYQYYYLGFNTTTEAMAEREVREAIDYLFSMDDFVENVVVPAGTRQHSPIPDRMADAWGMPLDAWKGIPHKKNTERAKSLLKKKFRELNISGWSPTIAAPHSDMMAQKLAKKVAHKLKALGFRRARTKTYHWRDYREKVTSGNKDDYSMFVGSWAGADDPDTFLYPLFHDNMIGLTNGTFYNAEEVVESIQKARETEKREKRKRHYERAITRILEDRAHLPGFTLESSFGVKGRVRGFEPHPLAQYNPRLVAPGGKIRLGD